MIVDIWRHTQTIFDSPNWYTINIPLSNIDIVIRISIVMWCFSHTRCLIKRQFNGIYVLTVSIIFGLVDSVRIPCTDITWMYDVRCWPNQAYAYRQPLIVDEMIAIFPNTYKLLIADIFHKPLRNKWFIYSISMPFIPRILHMVRVLLCCGRVLCFYEQCHLHNLTIDPVSVKQTRCKRIPESHVW